MRPIGSKLLVACTKLVSHAAFRASYIGKSQNCIIIKNVTFLSKSLFVGEKFVLGKNIEKSTAQNVFRYKKNDRKIYFGAGEMSIHLKTT